MKQRLLSFVLSIIFLFVFVETWAGTSKCVANSDPSDGGTVAVKYGSSKSSYGTSANKSNLVLFSSGTDTYYLYYKTNTNYKFRCWSKSQTSTTNLTSDGQSVSCSRPSTGTTTTPYYALFARMTADKSSIAFDSVYVGSSSSATTITITHAHADSITASLSGANWGDFVLSRTTPVTSSVAESSDTITVTFKPTCNGTRTATLTLKSSYTGLSDVTISLSGTGVLISNPLAVAATSKSMMVDDEWTGVVTAKGDGTISTSSSNSDVATYDVAKDQIVAKGEGTATITISQAAGCQYAYTSKTINVNVFNKKVPEFIPSFAGTTCALLVDGTATIELDNVSDGLAGDFTAVATDSTVVSVTRSGNTLTITGLKEDSTKVTLHQKETDGICATNPDPVYTFNVSRVTNTLAVAATSYPSQKVDDTWSCAVSSINSDAAITVVTNTTADSLIATYNSSTKTIDFNAKNAGTYTVTLTQPATYKYTATTKTITVTATKYSNAITVRMDGSVATSKSVYYGTNVAITLSSSNGSYEGEGNPFTITQTAGENLASYSWNDGSVTAGVVHAGTATGTATWKVRQEEDRKYLAAEETFSVKIVKITESCNLLTASSERTIEGSYSPSEWQIGSAKSVTFETKREGVSDKTITVYQKIDGGWVPFETTFTAGQSYASHTLNFDIRATGVKFETTSNTIISTYYSKIKNISVTRRNYLTTSVTENYLAFSPTIDEQKSKTFTVSYSTCDGGDLHIKSTNPMFTVSPTTISISDGTSGTTDDITITCANEATPVDSGYVVVYDKAKTCSIKVKVSRPEPVLTWNPYSNSYFVNSTIENICVSENTDYENCPLSYSSSDNSIAYVDTEGTLVILNKKESVTITVHQDENEDFLATTKTFTFTPIDMPDRAVPFVVNSTVYDEAVSKVGTVSWKGSDGVQLGKSAADGNIIDMTWDDKYIIFAFHGTPDKLTFSYKTSTSGNTGCDWYVAESPNGSSWSTTWSVNDNSSSWQSSDEIQLRPNTLFIKLCYSGNYAGFFKDIKVTELVGDYYLLDEANDKYLSRGKTWSTRAIEDEFGVPMRITRTTTDNTNIYTHLQFYDNRLYLFEDGSAHTIYTDNTDNNSWLMQEQSDGAYTLQSANGVGTNGQSITVGTDAILTLTTDGSLATHWTLEHADRHPARMTALSDAQAQAAAADSPDFGNDATWASLNEAMTEFDLIEQTLPTITINEQASVRTNNGTTDSYSYENTITVSAGLYRLTLEACYRPAPTLVAYENKGITGHENILAYMFANDKKTQLKSIYGDGTPVPSSSSNANTYFSAGRFQNYIFLYVEDSGDGTGTIHYGLHKPSFVSGDVLWYRNFILEKITRKEYILDGNGTDEETATWAISDNWTDNEKPGRNNWAIIRHDAVVTTPITVYGIRIENDAVLNIGAEGGLTIGAGGIVGATRDNLVLRAESEGANKGQTGYLRISPANDSPMPEASVEMFSIGYYDPSSGVDNSAAWQYVGGPVTPASSVTLEHTYYGSWVYRWDEATGTWSSTGNNGKMQPFQGYCTTQKKSANGMMHIYQGQIYSNKIDTTIALSYHTTAADGDYGFNLLANSFVAPIDLTNFRATDFTGSVEHTIYLYNTGAKNDWQAQQQDGTLFTSDRSTTAGQYVAIPVGDAAVLAALISSSAGAVPAVIPPMQGFRVNATGEDAAIRLNYNRLVWQANYTTYPNKPLRISERITKVDRETEEIDDAEIDDTFTAAIELTLYTSDSKDNIFLFEADRYTDLFDNGSDARKLDGGQFNIFATNSSDLEVNAVSDTQGNAGCLAVCATDNLENTTIGLRTGQSPVYTLRCSLLKEVIADNADEQHNYALRDLYTGELLPMTDGAEYTILATPEARERTRFVIERYNAPDSNNNTYITTDIVSNTAENGNVGLHANNMGCKRPASLISIYSPDGRLLYRTDNNADISNIHTLLPAGVYLLQTANQTIKIVKK